MQNFVSVTCGRKGPWHSSESVKALWPTKRMTERYMEIPPTLPSVSRSATNMMKTTTQQWNYTYTHFLLFYCFLTDKVILFACSVLCISTKMSTSFWYAKVDIKFCNTHNKYAVCTESFSCFSTGNETFNDVSRKNISDDSHIIHK